MSTEKPSKEESQNWEEFARLFRQYLQEKLDPSEVDASLDDLVYISEKTKFLVRIQYKGIDIDISKVDKDKIVDTQATLLEYLFHHNKGKVYTVEDKTIRAKGEAANTTENKVSTNFTSDIVSALPMALKSILPSIAPLLNNVLILGLAKYTIRASNFGWMKENTVVGMLVMKKIRSDTKTYLLLIGAICLHLLLVAFSVMEINYYLILFLVALMGLLHLNHQVLSYRIAKGLYGTNEYEAREIIQFILDHTDKTDFTDGSGQRKLMPTPEEIKRLEGFPEGVIYT